MVVDVLARSPAPPERVALVGRGRAWTYAELAAVVDARAEALRAGELPPGAAVPVVVDADVEGILTLLAFWRLGITPAPLHARLTDPEREAAARSLASSSPPTAAGVQAVLWTSGTAGRPRGVAITFEGLAASARAAAQRLQLAPDDVWLASLSPAHVGGIALVARALLLGSTLVADGPFEARRVSELIDGAEGSGPRGPAITHLSLVPTQLLRLLDARAEAPPAASLRLVLVGGARAPDGLVRRALAAGWPLALTYGLTEATSQVATAPPELVRAKPGTVGAPLEGVELRLAPDGEILVRGLTLAAGYVGTDERLADAEGWHRTGDLGRLDEEGHLWVTGRRIDRIVSGGVTVDAAEVEEALRAHPAVRDAAVVGLPDEEWGERVGAWVEPAAGATESRSSAGDAPPSELDPAALQRWLRHRLAAAKLPRVWHVGGGLPRNANGKLDRKAVRETLRRRGRPV